MTKIDIKLKKMNKHYNYTQYYIHNYRQHFTGQLLVVSESARVTDGLDANS